MRKIEQQTRRETKPNSFAQRLLQVKLVPEAQPEGGQIRRKPSVHRLKSGHLLILSKNFVRRRRN
jgi:hypothetical protein